jgi:hypothetical protein
MYPTSLVRVPYLFKGTIECECGQIRDGILGEVASPITLAVLVHDSCMRPHPGSAPTPSPVADRTWAPDRNVKNS